MGTHMRTLLLTAAVSALLAGTVSAPLAAQDPDEDHGSDVHGVVRDEEGTPLAAVAVRLPQLGRTELSHNDGSFHVERVPEGSHVMLFERIGYRTHTMTVTVGPEETTRLEIVL